MTITSVKATKINKDNLVAIASVTFDECFVVSGMRVMNGKNGLFVSMPSRKGKDKDGNDKYFDIYFPITKDFRQELIDAVLAEVGKEKTDDGFVPIPEIDDDQGLPF